MRIILLISLYLIGFPTAFASGIPLDKGQESEYKQVVRYLDKLLSKQALEVDSVIALSRPFQLLDIEATKIPKSQRSSFKNFNFGLMSTVFKVPKELTLKLPALALCSDNDCHKRRAKNAEKILAIIDELRAHLDNNQLSKVSVLGDKIFRMDNVFVMEPMLLSYEPTPIAGFVPSYEATQYDTISDSPLELQKQIEETHALRMLLMKHGIIAVVKENSALNVILAGISDNQYGMVVSNQAIKLPAEGGASFSGLELNRVVRLSDYAFYYQTN